MCRDHLVYMSCGGTQQKQRGPHDCSGPHSKAPLECQKADHRVSQAGRPDFKLKRALCPANEPGYCSTKEGMHQEVREKREADRKQQEVGKQRFNDNSVRQGARSPPKRDARNDQTQDQEIECKVFEQEWDESAQCRPLMLRIKNIAANRGFVLLRAVDTIAF